MLSRMFWYAVSLVCFTFGVAMVEGLAIATIKEPPLWRTTLQTVMCWLITIAMPLGAFVVGIHQWPIKKVTRKQAVPLASLFTAIPGIPITIGYSLNGHALIAIPAGLCYLIAVVLLTIYVTTPERKQLYHAPSIT